MWSSTMIAAALLLALGCEASHPFGAGMIFSPTEELQPYTQSMVTRWNQSGDA